MFLFSQKRVGELWQDAGAGENYASGEIRGIAHHGRASWGVVAASARCKALISLGFKELCKHGVLGVECSNHSVPTIFFNDLAQSEKVGLFHVCDFRFLVVKW